MSARDAGERERETEKEPTHLVLVLPSISLSDEATVIDAHGVLGVIKAVAKPVEKAYQEGPQVSPHLSFFATQEVGNHHVVKAVAAQTPLNTKC